MKRGGILLLMMVVAATARAASDNAADLAYSDGWQTGDNGGSGFGAWTLQTSTASPAANGLFIGSSNGNGFGNGPGIDSGGSAWGLYANNGQQFPGGASALRGFSLGIGQKLSIDMDNGFIDSGRTVALRLLVGGAIRFELQFVGGNSNYSVVGGGGTVDTGLPFTDGGLHVEFTLTGVDTYSVGITRLADSAEIGRAHV